MSKKKSKQMTKQWDLVLAFLQSHGLERLLDAIEAIENPGIGLTHNSAAFKMRPVEED